MATAGGQRGMKAVLGQPVVLGAVQLGTVTDVLANASLGHVLGFEIRGRDAGQHFLPWVAADLEEGRVRARSVFSLLSPSELATYLERGVRLSELLRGDARERLRDVLVDRYGDVAALVGTGDPGARPDTTPSSSAVQAAAKRSIP